MIEIISPSELRQDGVNLGAVFDVIDNHPKIPRPDIQRAFIDYVGRLQAEASTANAALAALKDHADSVILNVAKIVKEGDMDAIKSIALNIIKPENQRKKEALEKEADEAQAMADAKRAAAAEISV